MPKRKNTDPDSMNNEAKRKKLNKKPVPIVSLRVSDADDGSIEDVRITTIKVPIYKILFSDHMDAVLEHIEDLCVKITKISALSSLLLLMKVKTAFENDDERFFQENNYHTVIERCFKEVAASGIAIDRAQLDTDFQVILDRFGVEQPSTAYLGNSFRYQIEQSITSFKNTNALRQARQRFRKYFRTIHRDTDAINDTITYMLNDESYVPCDPTLMRSLPNIGLGNGDEYERGFFSKRRLFETIPIYMRMQQAIERFNEIPDSHRTLPRVGSFTVIPIFKSRRQHIRMDKDVLYRMFSKLNLITKIPGKGKRLKNTPFAAWKDEIMINDMSKVFDLETIKKLGGPKKTFHGHIVTDGVAASIVYDKNIDNMEKRTVDQRLAIIKEKFENSESKRFCTIRKNQKLSALRPASQIIHFSCSFRPFFTQQTYLNRQLHVIQVMSRISLRYAVNKTATRKI